MIKQEVIKEYLKGNIKSEEDLRNFLLQKNTEDKHKEMISKIENIKPTDVSKLENKILELNNEIDTLKEKLNEPIEVELKIE